MNIFIMRHGEAEMRARTDQERALTARGQQQAQAQGIWLKQTALFDKVLVSPYVRAQQTFEQIDQVYQGQLADKMETWSGITPHGDSGNVANYLSLLAENHQSVLIVSHLPLVGEIVTELCGSNAVSFYPSTIAQVEWQGQKGCLIQAKYPD